MLFVRQQPISVTPPGRRRAPSSHTTTTAVATPVPRHWQQSSCPYTPDANEPLDLEALALAAGSEYEDTWRSTRWRSDTGCSASHCSGTGSGSGASGLPLVCSNCGVSFFSLQITDDELECYCSGECKWSVIMYREMDRRIHALRRHLRAATTTTAVNTTATMNSTHGTTKSVKSYTSSSMASSSSSRSSAATVDTESCESYPRYMDDVIACR